MNLETIIHEFQGYSQAASGGACMASPNIAAELNWVGIDMVGHANNHTFDYFSIGVLENAKNVENTGLVRAGWRSFSAKSCFDQEEVSKVRILPLDLGFGESLPDHARQRYANRDLRQSNVEQILSRSRDFATNI